MFPDGTFPISVGIIIKSFEFYSVNLLILVVYLSELELETEQIKIYSEYLLKS